MNGTRSYHHGVYGKRPACQPATDVLDRIGIGRKRLEIGRFLPKLKKSGAFGASGQYQVRFGGRVVVQLFQQTMPVNRPAGAGDPDDNLQNLPLGAFLVLNSEQNRLLNELLSLFFAGIIRFRNKTEFRFQSRNLPAPAYWDWIIPWRMPDNA